MNEAPHFGGYREEAGNLEYDDIDGAQLSLAMLTARLTQFLFDPAFTGLHLISAGLVSFIFAMYAYPHFFPAPACVLPPPSAPSATAAASEKKKNGAKEVAKDDEDWEDEEEEGEDEDDEDDEDDDEAVPGNYQVFSAEKGNVEWKLVLCIRTDLEMTKGKIAAQCCHATLAAYQELSKQDPQGLRIWERHGQPKITLKCPSEDEMMELQGKALSLGIVAKVIRDAGRTQIAAGSKTVLAVGPAPKNRVDEVTSHLKLY
ncbi:hypothetical protein HDU96_006592 [Phlyctochytrium bullatum]|nr:hypothetical protein HDU96_006592 [Phlyctochytrium bullatum]